MSIVHISLLKVIIDSNMDTAYYILGIVLVSTAIVLQIVVGILALIVTNIDRYYSKFNDSVTNERKDNAYTDENVREILDELEGGHYDLFSVIKAVEENPNNDSDGTGQNTDTCCIKKVHPSYEASIIKWYNIWRVMMTRCELSAASVEQELATINMRLIADRAELVEVKHQREQLATPPEEGEPTKEELDKRIKSLEKKIKENSKKLPTKKAEQKWSSKRQASLVKQGDILRAYVDAVTREMVYKRISRYQRVINGLLYTVFILNAGIAGFGMSSLKGYVPPDTTVEPPTSGINATSP